MAREKVKFALRMAPETQELVKKMMDPDNCQTQNEFIEKAIRFYAGYVSSQAATQYLPVVLVDALRDTIDNSENRTARLLFKLAVEMDMMMNVLAVGMEVPLEDLEKLRAQCVRHVKETKGSISYCSRYGACQSSFFTPGSGAQIWLQSISGAGRSNASSIRYHSSLKS